VRIRDWSSDVCSSDLVKPMAEYPEATTMRIFHAIIIARQPFFPAPPFMRNPLRPLKTAHLMKGTPPAEAMRRSVRHFSHHLDLLRRIEQMEGTHGRLPG